MARSEGPSSAPGGAVDLETILDEVLEQALSITDAERGFVVHLKGDYSPEKPFETVATRDFDPQSSSEPAADFSRTIVSEVIQTQEPLILLDALSHSRFGATESITKMGLRSIAAFPLVFDGVVLGALYLENRTLRGVFKDSDLDLLEAFARVAAMALVNAQVVEVYQETQQNSMPAVSLAEIGHRLRNPLSVIIGFSELLSHTPMDADQQRRLKMIQDGGEEMLATLESLIGAHQAPKRT